MAKVQHTYIDVTGQKIPVKIYTEYRKNVRATIGKEAAILRLPSLLSTPEKQNQFAWFRQWVLQQFEEDESLGTRFFGRKYTSGDVLWVGDRRYILSIKLEHRNAHAAKLIDGVIYLKLSNLEPDYLLQRSIRTLLSRIVAKDFQSEIEDRVHYLNDHFFGQRINSIRLKYNQSNWGSCSAKGNINLSTRLLFAPSKVIDYVIIHELAHLIELNHSDRFWEIVSDIMPNYKKAEGWLKDNGHFCEF